MLEKFISPGDKLEMKAMQEVKLPDGTEGIKLYKSTVYDVVSEGVIEIMMPMEKTKLVLLPVDGEYDVCFFSHNGLYQANIRILDRKKVNNAYVLVAELTSSLRKFQRREFYRFNCVIEMKIKELNKEEAEAVSKDLGYLISETSAINGVIVDISGGGLRFVTKQELNQESIYYFKFKLSIEEKDREFEMAAKLLSVKKIENRENDYENRAKFLYLDNTTREEIIKFIFDEERKNRKNGKGR